VPDQEITACSACKLLPLHIASQADHHIEIGFGRRDGGSSCIARSVHWQIVMYDDGSLAKAIRVPILLSVSFSLILVTELCDMIIHQCMSKGRMGDANVLGSPSH